MRNWTNHFTKILKGTKEPTYPKDCVDVGPLDFTITLEEVQDATYILKTNKACGIDSISNEMLSCVVKTDPTVILHLLNAFLDGKTLDTNVRCWHQFIKREQGQIRKITEVYLLSVH